MLSPLRQPCSHISYSRDGEDKVSKEEDIQGSVHVSKKIEKTAVMISTVRPTGP